MIEFIVKVVIPSWYSDMHIVSRKIKWNLPSVIDSELWKFPNFDGSDLKSLIRYQNILWICSLRYENIVGSYD